MQRAALHPVTLLRLLLVGCFIAQTAAAAPVAQEPTVLVVDADGDAAYSTISAALADAEAGDTIEVRPGTYRERLNLTKNVTIVAPRGATLNGSTFKDSDPDVESIGLEADGVGGNWTLKGLRFVDYTIAIDASDAAGAWTLQDVTVVNASWYAVNADDGDWTIRNLTVTTADRGIDATGADGDWTVRNATLRDVEFSAVSARGSEGTWTVENLTVRNALIGVDAAHASGDWRLRDARIRDVTVGIAPLNASGDWTVARTTVRNATVSEQYDFLSPAFREGTAVHASETTGQWTIRNATLEGAEADVVARGANPGGRTVEIDWGASGPGCVGNVSCAPGVTAQPTANSTATATPAQPTTATSPQETEETDFPTETPTTATPTTGSSQPLSPGLVLVAALVVAVRQRRR